MSDNLYTIALLKAKPEKTASLREQLEHLATETRKEAGALEYGFIQAQDDPQLILSYEKWKDAEAETAHWQTPHLLAAIDAFKDLLEGDPAIYKGRKII